MPAAWRIQRGPFVYCFEAVDNGGQVPQHRAERDPQFEIATAGRSAGRHHGHSCSDATRIGRSRRFLITPWDHREPGAMLVWVRQDGKSREPTSG